MYIVHTRVALAALGALALRAPVLLGSFITTKMGHWVHPVHCVLLILPHPL
jgi:hypothetical protein